MLHALQPQESVGLELLEMFQPNKEKMHTGYVVVTKFHVHMTKNTIPFSLVRKGIYSRICMHESE